MFPPPSTPPWSSPCPHNFTFLRISLPRLYPLPHPTNEKQAKKKYQPPPQKKATQSLCCVG